MLFVLVSAGCIVLGVVAEIIALRAGPEDHARAMVLSRYGFFFIAVGIGIGLVFWLFRRLKD